MMAEEPKHVTNGARGDDTFEQDLQEILEDGPNLNDLSSTVQSGSPQRVLSTSAYAGSAGIYGNSAAQKTSRLTRSYTVPPGVFFLTFFTKPFNNSPFYVQYCRNSFLWEASYF